MIQPRRNVGVFVLSIVCFNELMENNFWQKIRKPIVGLAPMAGITDSPFRQIGKIWGARLLYSEMISSYGIFYKDKKSLDLCKFKEAERPIIIQIFGREPNIMAEAAAIIEKKFKPDGLDVNFGCPARRVVKSGHGAALMDEPKLAEKIVREIVKKINLPVSVKTRLGKNKKTEIFDFAKRMEEAGAIAIAVHGRTFLQDFSGEADWSPIYKLKEKTKMIVLGNGDIRQQSEIKKKIKNLDGVLIGRGTLGNPFIFSEKEPDRKQIIDTILSQAKIALAQKGERGLIEMRKHLGWYVKGMLGAKSLRQRLVQIKTIEEIKKILKSFEIYGN